MLNETLLLICLQLESKKQKKKRSRQSDVMSDIENLDVMLGNYPSSDVRDQENV